MEIKYDRVIMIDVVFREIKLQTHRRVLLLCGIYSLRYFLIKNIFSIVHNVNKTNFPAIIQSQTRSFGPNGKAQMKMFKLVSFLVKVLV